MEKKKKKGRKERKKIRHDPQAYEVSVTLEEERKGIIRIACMSVGDARKLAAKWPGVVSVNRVKKINNDKFFLSL